MNFHRRRIVDRGVGGGRAAAATFNKAIANLVGPIKRGGGKSDPSPKRPSLSSIPSLPCLVSHSPPRLHSIRVFVRIVGQTIDFDNNVRS